MKTKIKLLLAALFCAGMVSAQVNLGTLRGQLVDEEYGQTIPFVKVWVDGQGKKNGQMTDADGKFKFEALQPGLYNFYAQFTGKDTIALLALEIKPDEITNLGTLKMAEKSIEGGVVTIWADPLISDDVGKISIRTKDIAVSLNIRNPKELFASFNSDIVILEGTDQMIIRGSRPGDAIYYVDGVKTDDLNGVPGVGIGSMTGYTGGIPAKYGDTTGGVVVLETKGYFDLYYAWLAGQ